jgi:uncharacterized protein
MSLPNADYWITKLNLLPHPEGGYFRETYRGSENFKQSALPNRFSGDRQFSTAIYFLLRSQDRSMFHRIQSDELWHYHAGDTLSIFVLHPEGLQVLKLGPNIDAGESLQIVVPAGKWFGALVDKPNTYTLAGCTVSPGFDFADFEIAPREQLIQSFPEHHAIIQKLTK